MSSFSDLVKSATPALFGGGVFLRITEGRDVDVRFNVTGSDGGPIDDFAMTSGECLLFDGGGNQIFEFDVNVDADGFDVVGAAIDMEGLANALAKRDCTWKCSLTNGGQIVQAWSAANSLVEVWGS